MFVWSIVSLKSVLISAPPSGSSVTSTWSSIVTFSSGIVISVATSFSPTSTPLAIWPIAFSIVLKGMGRVLGVTIILSYHNVGTTSTKEG